MLFMLFCYKVYFIMTLKYIITNINLVYIYIYIYIYIYKGNTVEAR